jgi:hypothetical protein
MYVWIIGSGYAIMIGSSTYVGMITVGREQTRKASLDMVTREVGRDRLVRARFPRRESYKRRREEKRSQQPALVHRYHNLTLYNI